MTSHAHSSHDACSMMWDSAQLPAAGTASRAAFWVALEQPGPWGREAITQSHLNPQLGADLERACSDAGGRLLMVREPGRHADHLPHQHLPRVWIAGGLAHDPWLLEGQLDQAADLLALPWPLLTGADPDEVTMHLPVLEETREALLLVCTNGRRDVCCAVRGRPIAAAAAAARPGRVLECSHTGGHRFAPTGIMLPSGQTWARLTEETALLALDAERHRRIPAELNHPAYDRGLSHLRPPEQAALSWARQQGDDLRHGALRTTGSDGDVVTVEHEDGAVWRVRVERVQGEQLKDSCLKQPKPSVSWRATPA